MARSQAIKDLNMGNQWKETRQNDLNKRAFLTF